MKRTAPVLLAVATLLAGPVLAQSTAPVDNVDALLGASAQTSAQTPARPAQVPNPASATALELKGETNAPAPDSEQNPVEVSITQRLNAQVAERNELADQTDHTNQAAYAEAVHEYTEQKADVEAETERQAIDAQINAQSRAEYDADQEARYQKAMADWRATVAACDRGDTARCNAGSMPARPGSPPPVN
ncbi:cell wall hydrolase [Brevundimonas goettingensis]|uniref:Cell wall hydrolase n=1 Tax=Brevundimonas goettingensis TaxID=2774190 RepID=A0A975GW47_9CAUL|nr:cell wall hydrolase [Brevundimonas goettingensis]QTC91359.1 cell wall hydrolase [Brevundimonas goettingensis]